jgi:glycosyltransferase involved in cell wall biosynthesis
MSGNAGPLVSVVVPAYNAEKFLAEAIDSILAQTHTNTEIIIVNDGSTDRTAVVAEGYGDRVKLIHRENGGIGPARNTGIEQVTGEFIALLDADDIWEPQKLAQQLALLEAEPEVAMVFGQMVQFASEGPALPEELAKAAPAMLPGLLLIRTEAFHRVGPFAADYKLGEFIDWSARANEVGLQSKIIAEVFLRRRYHANNTGRTAADSRGDYARVLKAALDRRRAQGSQ